MLCKLNYKVQSIFRNLNITKISETLADQSTEPQFYGTLINTILNGTNISPLFHNNKFLLTSKKRVKKIFFLQNSVHYLIMGVHYPHSFL